jgi:hypothetical protein
MNKINIIPIVLGHIRTLRNNATGKVSAADVCLFFGLPLLFAGFGLHSKWTLSVGALNSVLAAFSIFAGLLFNLLVLVYTFSTDTAQPNALAKVRGTVIRELHDNISYAVLIAILIVIVALTTIARLEVVQAKSAGPYASFIVFYFTVNFAFTLLMILKRIHTILRQRFEQPQFRKAS